MSSAGGPDKENGRDERCLATSSRPSGVGKPFGRKVYAALDKRWKVCNIGTELADALFVPVEPGGQSEVSC